MPLQLCTDWPECRKLLPSWGEGTQYQLQAVACSRRRHGFFSVPLQVESYANMVEPIVDALLYSGPLFFDVLTFVLLRRLAGPRRKMKEDQVNLADWCVHISGSVLVMQLFRVVFHVRAGLGGR